MRALWFGPEDRPLFGWLHAPEGELVRGAVVLCAPLGMEAANAGHTFRSLADRLSEVGFVALRFDYDGTGDSAGRLNDPKRVEAWLGSVREATDLVRTFGLSRVSVIGMRMGATLAVEALGSISAPVDDLVLWDPCATGRSFLREQSALGSVMSEARASEDGSIEAPGFVYDKTTVEDLSRLEIANVVGPWAKEILFLTRVGRKGDRKLNDHLHTMNARRQDIRGQEDLLDVQAGFAEVPEATIESIVQWLGERSAGQSAPKIDLQGVGRPRGIVGRTGGGETIEEEVLTIGPSRLFGIMTSAGRPKSDLAESSRWKSPPTVYFVNAGTLDHVGPARLWVQLSRSWAEAGLRLVRFDFTGLGESPTRAGRPLEYVYAPEAIDEVLSAMRTISHDDPTNAVLVGLCSGGYHAIEGAINGKVRGVCAINPVLTFSPPEVRVDAPLDLQMGKLDVRRQASGAKKNWTRAIPAARSRLGPMVQRLPDWAWWILNRVVVESPPARTLSKVLENDSHMLVIVGQREGRLLRRGESGRIRRLARTGRFHLEVIPDLEHTLFERRGRERVIEMLTEYIVGNYGTVVPPVPEQESHR
jgi:pimeloyl-ACP methyl ester carboxylesterase